MLTHHRLLAHERDAHRSRTSRLALRARVLLHAHRLDAMLLEGADPAESPELEARCRQLTSRACRDTLAEGLEHVLTVAERRTSPVSAAPPLAKREIIAARASLISLIDALKDERPVEPAGVVLTERLLTDGLSPLYVEGEHDALWHTARNAIARLEGQARL